VGGYVTSQDRVLRCVVSTAERNASLHPQALAEGLDALRALGPETGAVLLVGEGPSFCTGGDVGAFGSAEDPETFIRQVADAFHAFLLALVEAPVPVVAAVHGWAAGAGMSLVCASDLAIAGTSTFLKPGYPSLGFTPDGGMTWTLPRLVGAGRARAILLQDRAIDAATGLDYGIFSQVVGDDEVAGKAERLAARLASGPTTALGGIKRLLQESGSRSLADHLDVEGASIARSAAGPEGREGVAAFNERRKPRFSG
jgi:2-(1,2-epoxy-1,2-dihydrophenyl)acetyl-CoA isomerase